MKCKVCNGSGRVDNPRYYRQSPIESYLDGIPSMIDCKVCKGKGYIIKDIKEIVNVLETAVKYHRGISASEVEQILKIIKHES